MVKLLIDNEKNTLVDFASGKVGKNGKRKPIKKQKGMTCTLYGMRRLAYLDPDKKEEFSAYKQIKNALKNFNHNYLELALLGYTLCGDLRIDLEQALSKNNSFMSLYMQRSNKELNKCEYLRSLPHNRQWVILYDIISKYLLLPLMNLHESTWHPRDGFKGLQESLKKHGAHAFLGKFGQWCHTQKAKTFKEECTKARHTYFFQKDTYVGDNIPFTHCVVVDQAKVVNGKEMIFFHDPSKPSTPGKVAKIYMLSYETFVSRLCNTAGNRFVVNPSNDDTFGYVSKDADKLNLAI